MPKTIRKIAAEWNDGKLEENDMSIFSNRIASWENNVAICTGKRVYKLAIDEALSGKAEQILQLQTAPQAIAATQASDMKLITVDAYGIPQIHTKESTDVIEDKREEFGWSGVDVSGNEFAVAHSFGQSLKLYDIASKELTRSINTTDIPNCIRYTRHSSMSLIGTAENHMVNLWDKRVDGASACIQRLEVGRKSPIHSFDTCDNYLIAGGADRSLYVFDTRIMRIIAAAQGCLKYEITSCAFSKSQPNIVYVWSHTDSELTSIDISSVEKLKNSRDVEFGNSEGKKMRADSRWTGIAQVSLYGKRTDSLVGISNASSIYLMISPEELARPQ